MITPDQTESDYESLGRFFPKDIAPQERAEMISLLKNEIGLVVFDKRPLNIPEVTDSELGQVFGKESVKLVRSCLVPLLNFIYGVPVGDRFGADHTTRREKRAEVYLRLKEENPEMSTTYWSFYHDSNQFRGNLFALVDLRMKMLAELAQESGNEKLAQAILAIEDDLLKASQGEEFMSGNAGETKYDEMASPEDKLGVVQRYEDGIIKTLQLCEAP